MTKPEAKIRNDDRVQKAWGSRGEGYSIYLDAGYIFAGYDSRLISDNTWSLLATHLSKIVKCNCKHCNEELSKAT